MARKRRILLVSKDIGDTQVVLPVAQVAIREGYEVFVITEGMGAPFWLRAGIAPLFVGTSNFEEIPFTLDVGKVMEQVSPDTVVAGLACPINLANQFAKESNHRSVPLIVIEDYWASLVQLTGARPDLVLSPDEFSQDCARSRLEEAVSVQIVGNHAVLPESYTPIAPVREAIAEARKHFDHTILYVDSGPVDEMRLLVRCLLVTPGNWCLIPRFHPKNVDQSTSTGRERAIVYRETLSPVRERIVECCGGTSDDVALLADITASGCSSSLSTASGAGKVAISLWTPATQSSFEIETGGLSKFPLALMELAHTVTSASNLLEFTPATAKARAKLKPYDPERAFGFIREMVG